MINMMESIVKQKLNSVLAHTDCCQCPVCYSDMLAIALNSVSPKYTNTLQGELLVKVDQASSQNSVDVNIAVAKAIEIVSSNPRHQTK